MRGPGIVNFDAALLKNVNLSEQVKLQFGLETFNFVNHANWNDPDTEIGPASAPNANAGRIIGSTGGRVLQLGARYNF